MARLLLARRPAAALLLVVLGLAATTPARGALEAQREWDGASIHVEDDWIDAAQATEIAARLPPRRPTADSPYTQPVAVPAPLYTRLLSLFSPTAGEAAAEAATGADGTVAAAAGPASVVVPGRSERGDVFAHADRWYNAGSGVADTTVGLVYLEGDGQMAFKHKTTGKKTVVDVKPGRLMMWDNAAYTHALVAGGAARAMLGPMAFKSGGLHEVGAPYGWEADGQLCFKTLRPKAGSVIKATAAVFPKFWATPTALLSSNAPTDPDALVITLAHDAAAGQLSYLKASLSPNPNKGHGIGAGSKIQPVVGQNNAVTFSIPADKVRNGTTEYKVTWTYRLAKNVVSGTEIDFTLGAGSSDGTSSLFSVNELTTVTVK